MKSNSTPQKTPHSLKAIFALGICGSLLMAPPSFASGGSARKFPVSNTGPGEDEPAKKTKSKTRSFAFRNNSSVKLYPDVVKRDMHVVAKDNDGKEIDFFVFDLQGTLVKNYKMKAKDHYRISGLARGLYVYRVFSGDTETASGKFEIR